MGPPPETSIPTPHILNAWRRDCNRPAALGPDPVPWPGSHRVNAQAVGTALVSITIWVALVLYVIAERGKAIRPSASPPLTWPRVVWSLACASYLAHVVTAFDRHHGWSHAAAYAHTAEQTAALVGLAWGGGIWFNYAFTTLWIGEAAWWWMAPASYTGRRRGLEHTVRGVFLFMIVNGAVVFVDGPMRWVGVVIVVWLIWMWWTA